MRAETSGKCDIKSDTPQRSRSSRINIDGGILLIGLNLLRRLIGNTDMVAQTTPFTENLGRHPGEPRRLTAFPAVRPGGQEVTAFQTDRDSG